MLKERKQITEGKMKEKIERKERSKQNSITKWKRKRE